MWVASGTSIGISRKNFSALLTPETVQQFRWSIMRGKAMLKRYSGITAVASISTFARFSIRALTTTIDIGG